MFNSLSRRMVVSGNIQSPASVVTALLTNIVAHLGADLVGHAKAVAYVEGGMFHASTTGADADIDVKSIGSPSNSGGSFQLDFMCVFHGLRYRRLLQAWDSAVATLAASGLRVTPVENVSAAKSAAPSTAVPIVGALASSFLVLKPCCLIPLLWSVSGSGIVFLQILAPLERYRPAFIVVTLVLLLAAFHRLYVNEAVVVNETTQRSVRTSKRVLWFATAVFLVSTLYPIVAPQQPHAMHHSAGHIHH